MTLDNFVKLVLFAIFGLIIVELTYNNWLLNMLTDNTDALSKLHNAYILIFTLLLVVVAWYQLHKLNKTSKADFLLRIDNHYGSNEIIKARKIIHEFYCQTLSKECTNEQHIEKIANEIKNIERQQERSNDFIYLLNFLDFLETISYFANKKHVSRNEVRELLGGSITYYYKTFKPWIIHRREKYNDNSYYSEIQKYVKHINKDPNL